jgi:hypothetical protein
VSESRGPALGVLEVATIARGVVVADAARGCAAMGAG